MAPLIQAKNAYFEPLYFPRPKTRVVFLNISYYWGWACWQTGLERCSNVLVMSFTGAEDPLFLVCFFVLLFTYLNQGPSLDPEGGGLLQHWTVLHLAPQCWEQDLFQQYNVPTSDRLPLEELPHRHINPEGEFPRVPWCLEHTGVVTDPGSQGEQRGPGSSLAWLMPMAYGLFIPHKLVETALARHHVPFVPQLQLKKGIITRVQSLYPSSHW